MGLRVREIRLCKGKGQYEFIVTDNGIGMSGISSLIFLNLSPGPRSQRPTRYGAGLGMAITQNIVSMMNGTVEVKSVLGEGSSYCGCIL
ncbi:MAG: sensor histidine kinase [Eisenbergiella sp.]